MQRAKDFLFIGLVLVTAQTTNAIWFDPDVMVGKLNAYRLSHNANPLTVDEKMILNSMSVAYNLINNMKISCDIDRYGMSTYWFRNDEDASENIKTIVETVTNAWYSEGRFYDFTDEPFNKESTKNFTQIVWKNTEKIGTGIWANGHRAVVVVLYSPKGNQTGQFVHNVGPPINA